MSTPSPPHSSSSSSSSSFSPPTTLFSNISSNSAQNSQSLPSSTSQQPSQFPTTDINTQPVSMTNTKTSRLIPIFTTEKNVVSLTVTKEGLTRSCDHSDNNQQLPTKSSTVQSNSHKPDPLLVTALNAFIRCKQIRQKCVAQEIGVSETVLSKYMQEKERKRG